MATLNCNNNGGSSFNNSSTENGDALPEEKSLSIDYSEDLWLANSEDSSSAPYAPQQPTSNSVKVTAANDDSQASSNVSVVSGGDASQQVPASGYHSSAAHMSQQHWNQVGEHRQEDEEAGGTIIPPSTTAYINGTLDQNGMEFNNGSGEEKDFAQLVPAGTYVQAGAGGDATTAVDPVTGNKTFTALMPVGVNGEEMHHHPGGFTTMLQDPDGQQQMVFYGSGEQVQVQVGADDPASHQMLSQQQQSLAAAAAAYQQQHHQHHPSAQGVIVDGQDTSAASGEDGAGEGSLYVAMDGVEAGGGGHNGQQVVGAGPGGENYTLVSQAVLSNMENVKLESGQAGTSYADGSPNVGGGNFQNISTLPFVQNGAYSSQAVYSVDGGQEQVVEGSLGNGEAVPGEYQQHQQQQQQGAIDYEQEEGNSENSNMGEASEFTCQVCQEGFEDQASLDGHMENHPPAKSFICETCSKSFATRRYLKYHRKNHCKRAGSYEGRDDSEEASGAFPNEVKRFSCNVCSRPFRVLKCMKVHKKKKHGILKDFTCPNCAVTFASPQQLTDHPCQPPASPSATSSASAPVVAVGGVAPAVVPAGGQGQETGVGATTPTAGQQVIVPIGLVPQGQQTATAGQTTPFMSARRKKKLRQTKPTCDICGKVFGDRISLDIHRVKHIEEEFYPCDMCAVDTTSPDNPTHLAVHFRIKFFTDDNQHILEDQKAAAEAMRVEDINPSSIIATAAACTNIIDQSQDPDGAQYLEDSTGEYSSSSANVSAVIPQSPLMGGGQQPQQQQAYSEYPGGAVGEQQQQQQLQGGENVVAASSAVAAAGGGGGGGQVTKTVIRAKPHICDICNKSFAEAGKLELHYKTNHMEERPFHCTICDKSFFTKWKLQRHMLSHLEIKPHSCPACSKSFVERGKLEAHYRTHLGTKPYKCEHCTKAFTVKSQLTIHVRRIHSADQPFGCEVCGKAFLWKSGLEKHMRKHTREKPYACTLCRQKYSQKSNLVSHLAKVHNEHQPPNTPQPQQQQQPQSQQQQLQQQPEEEEEEEEEEAEEIGEGEEEQLSQQQQQQQLEQQQQQLEEQQQQELEQQQHQEV